MPHYFACFCIAYVPIPGLMVETVRVFTHAVECGARPLKNNLVTGAAFSMHLFALLLSDTSKIIFYPELNANSCRTSSTTSHELSMYLFLLLHLAGDIEIISGLIKFQSLNIDQLNLCLI